MPSSQSSCARSGIASGALLLLASMVGCGATDDASGSQGGAASAAAGGAGSQGGGTTSGGTASGGASACPTPAGAAGPWQPLNLPPYSTIDALARDPIESEVFYARSIAGLFRSSKTAGCWDELGPIYPTAPVDYPFNALRVIALAGQPTRRLTVAEGQLWVSDDAGRTWTARSAPEKIVQIVADPFSGTRVYGVGSRGAQPVLWLSEDLGETWTSRSIGGSAQGLLTEPNTLTLDPLLPGKLYASSLRWNPPLWSSSDDGATWAAVTTPFDALLSDFALVATSSGTALYLATTNGLLVASDSGPFAASTLPHAADPNLRLEVDPALAGALLVINEAGAGVLSRDDQRENHAFALPTQAASPGVLPLLDPMHPEHLLYPGREGLLESHDSGASWRPFQPAAFDMTSARIALDPSSADRILLNLPSREGTQLFASQDGGRSFMKQGSFAGWLEFQFDARNDSVVYGLANSLALAGASSSASVHISEDRGQSFRVLTLAEADWIAVDEFSANTLYAYSLQANTPCQLRRSLDRGDSWTCVYEQASFAGRLNRFWSDPRDPQVLFAAESSCCRLARSSDAGASWTFIEGWSSLGSQAMPAPELVLPKARPERVLARTASGIFASDDRGATWTQLTQRWFDALVADPSSPDTLYARDNDGWHKSANGGFEFHSIASGLLGRSRATLRVAPSQPSVLYALADNVAPSGSLFRLLRSASAGE